MFNEELGDAVEIEMSDTVFTATVNKLEPAEAILIVNIDLAIDIEVKMKYNLKFLTNLLLSKSNFQLLEESQVSIPLKASEREQSDFAWQIGFLGVSRNQNRPEQNPDHNPGETQAKFPGRGLSSLSQDEPEIPEPEEEMYVSYGPEQDPDQSSQAKFPGRGRFLDEP